MFEHVLTQILVKYLTDGRVSEGNVKLDRLVIALFFLGLGFMLGACYLLEKTIIEISSPFLILLFPGLFLTSHFYDKLNDIDGLRIHWIVHYFLHTVISGSALLFIFVASNYYLSDHTLQQKQIKIVSKYTSTGPKGHEEERSPSIIFNYEGIKTSLHFKYPDMEKVMKAKTVKLSVKKGYWGYYIIEKYAVE